MSVKNTELNEVLSNTLHLFAKCCLYVLPFALVWANIINVFDNTSNNYFVNLMLLLLTGLITSFLGAIILSLNHGSYISSDVDYLAAIKNGINRTPQLFLFTVAFTGLFILAWVLTYYLNCIASLVVGEIPSLAILLIIAIIMMIVCTYVLIMPALIVNHRYNVFYAFIQSVKMVKGYAIETFFLILFFIIVISLASTWLGTMARHILMEMLFASLMVYLSNTLANTKELTHPRSFANSFVK